ncbi:M23 family metallopeptidase [Alkalicoccobacillus murimartini]|uniref:Stage II sporulation protein Q n=1 Tax=Alkalicoccobacillus murimartini TaxID=171685 RepID=A0ABT9YGN8_9BACI|nr:M23 family metallopeptidase [Alkalicoccobacillus murimartini]MDQ0207025.1 stage II sporulation protein Q [Alkalicoccobacillus murimartini]
MKEDNNRSSKNESKWSNAQRLLRKRWVLPAVYLAAAAGILSSVFYFQGQNLGTPLDQESQEQPSDEFQVGYDPRDEEAIPVQSSTEVIVRPTLEDAQAEIIGHFYDESASAEEQQASLVYYSNTYRMNKGVDFGAQTEEGFDVVAALSGKVTKAQQDSTIGNVVEITHDDGVKTHYSSLASLEVEEGDTINQGDKLGEAGRNLYNETAGVHVHFEIRDNEGEALNPEDFFGQSLEQAVKETEETEKEVPEQDAPEQDADKEKEADDDEDKDTDKDNTDAPTEEEQSGLVPSESSNT